MIVTPMNKLSKCTRHNLVSQGFRLVPKQNLKVIMLVLCSSEASSTTNNKNA
jgi:hypothetical protein